MGWSCLPGKVGGHIKAVRWWWRPVLGREKLLLYWWTGPPPLGLRQPLANGNGNGTERDRVNRFVYGVRVIRKG
jgi:hypothetical protein